MKLPIQLRALKERDILECITLFQNTIHTVNAKDYSPIQLEAWAPKVKPEINPRWQTLSENIAYVAELRMDFVTNNNKYPLYYCGSYDLVAWIYRCQSSLKNVSVF